jgi:asparaginyl-tRNA synthetase
VIVTDYPTGIKAFYMRLNDGGKTVAAMDVLAPKVGEIIGGSQREERLDVLERRIEEAAGLPKKITGGTWTCAAMAPCPMPGLA